MRCDLIDKAKKLREPAFLGERHDKLQPDNLLGE